MVLMQNVYKVLGGKKDRENALVGSLIVLEALTQENIFGEETV